MALTRSDATVPLLALVVAFAFAAFVLPSTLRPPPDPATTAAEFSPDAPPDDNQDSIVAALSRGSSATAGGGDVTGTAPPGDQVVVPQQLPPAACPGGFGAPKRQAESIYAAPCASAFAGDNGGNTWRGVTENEIRIAVVYRGGDTGMQEGPVQSPPPAREDDQNRTLRVYQEYFNRTFQLYGRQLRLFAVSISTNAEDQAAGAVRAAEEYSVFGSVQLGAAAVPYTTEAHRRGLVTFNSVEFADEWYRQRAPLAYNWDFGSTTGFRLGAEYVCKKLAGRPAAFGGPDVAETTRKFGMVFYSEGTGGMFDRNGEDMNRLLQDGCGEQLEVVVGYDLRNAEEAGPTLATSMARMREAGVTSIIYAGATVQAPQFAAQADQLGYQPEWFLAGLDGIEEAAAGRRVPASQWRHAFGLDFSELPRLADETDAWRAYRTIEPAGEPDDTTAEAFYSLLQMANGFQKAGPELTPEAFARGLHSLGKRPAEPVWSVGGGFAPGDPTFAEYAAQMWWDPTAEDPVSGQPGAYRYVDGGRRFTFGELDSAPSRMFSDGTTSGW